jgi:cytochrome c
MRCPERRRIALFVEDFFEVAEMRKAIGVLLFVCVSACTSFAYADYELLVKSNCLACHYLDKRKYGPKLNEVASKYVNDASAAEKLAKKIKSGGTGVWGEDVMPPQPQLSDDDALKLAKYVLALK